MSTISFNDLFESVTAPTQYDKERSEFAHQILEICKDFDCMNCGKNLPDKDFYHTRDGIRDAYCKDCMTATLNCEYPPLVELRCKRYDIPYIEDEWNKRLQREKEKHGDNYSPKSVFGKYFATMKLCSFKELRYKDGYEINQRNKIKRQYETWDEIKKENPNLQEDIIEKLSQIGSVNPIPYEELKTILPIQEEFNLEKELARMEEKKERGLRQEANLFEEAAIAAKDNINPKHYRREGGIESIDEMEMIFGIEATMHFCLLNVWKYRYRAADKNGEEDLKKSDWYMRKYQELKDKKELRATSILSNAQGSYTLNPDKWATVPLTVTN